MSYKVSELVSNVPYIAKHTDSSLSGASGITIDCHHTLWVANHGNNEITANVTHYDHHGNKLSDTLPFIDYESPTPLVPPSQQRQLISDLLWLEKNINYYWYGRLFSIPRIYPLPPILGTIGRQPSTYELDMRKFYNKPNGYFGSLVDITYLINFCINRPLPLTTPNGKKATAILSNAHSITYKQLLLDLHDQDLINQYSAQLVLAQSWLRLSAPNPVLSEPYCDTCEYLTTSVPSSDQLPIALMYNNTKGFVGFELNGIRASSDLIAGTPKGVIYVYSHINNIGQYYGMITAINNTNSYSCYTGLTMLNEQLYMCDLANQRIEVYNAGWDALRTYEDKFVDPELPANYTPYNIVAYHDQIIILYAMLDTSSPAINNQLMYGDGLGIINVFSSDGVFIRRAVTGGHLNAPWGVTIVKKHFADGKFLVSNHGNGHLLLYDKCWQYVRHISDDLDGIYGSVLRDNKLYVASAPNDGVSGLISKIKQRKEC